MKKRFIREHFNGKNSLITVAELSNALLVSKKTIYRMIKSNLIEGFKIGGYYVITISSAKKIIKGGLLWLINSLQLRMF